MRDDDVLAAARRAWASREAPPGFTRYDIPGLEACHRCGLHEPWVFFAADPPKLPTVGDVILCRCGAAQEVSIDGLKPVPHPVYGGAP